jgi:hypothetical protein
MQFPDTSDAVFQFPQHQEDGPAMHFAGPFYSIQKF